MKISILDDYHDTLRTLRCFARLEGHDVAIWTDHVQDEDLLAERLRNIFTKLGLSSRAAATAYAYERRILQGST